MKKTDETDSVINYFYVDKVRSDQYLKDNLNLMMTRCETGLSSIKWHKKVLGKQKYCWISFVKNWVWETDTWRVYVSKRGSSFELLKGLTLDQAWEAWQDYYNRMTRK
jgi:hypothetical protein